jgi:hypothetical protein
MRAADAGRYVASLNRRLCPVKLCNVILFGSLFFSQIACGYPQPNQIISITSTQSASPTSPPHKDYPNLKIQAEELAKAFDRQDYESVASLTYPKLVELMGGREGMAAILRRSMKQAEETENVKLISTMVGEPGGIIRVERQLFAIVPTTLRMKVPEGVLVGKAFMIGVSEDNGENWTFVDGSGGRNEEKMKTLLPAAVGKLKLPELKPPVLEREP